jgi:predicted DNA-binding transcriptional regulator YafY
MTYKSSDINQLRRWIALDELFRRPKFNYSIKELRNKLEERYAIIITRDTIYKDFNTLNSIFNDKIQIVNDTVTKKWHYKDHRQSILNYSIDKDTSNHLRLLLKLIKDDIEQPVFDKTKAIIDAICNYETTDMEITEADISKKHDKSIILGNDVPENKIFFDEIFSAITTKQAIMIIYQKFNKEAEIKILSPLGFKKHNNNWYFIARDNSLSDDDNPKIYKLSKVEKIYLLDGDYQRQPNFSLKEYFKYSIGIFQINDEKPIDLKILIEGEKNINRFYETPFVQDVRYTNKQANSVIAEMSVFNSYELMNELFSYGLNIKIIGPEDFIPKYIKELKVRLGAYE